MKLMESSFLCDCGNLKYIDFKTKGEYCLNEECSKYKQIKTYYRKDEAEKAFNRLKVGASLTSRKFSPIFRKHLFYLQNLAFRELYLGSSPKIDYLLNISHLIFLTRNVNFRGRQHSLKSFSDFLLKNNKLFETWLFYQDVKEENWILTDLPDRKMFPLKLKYFDILNDQRNNYGMVSDMYSTKNFKYAKLDFESIEKQEFEPGMDLGIFFLQFFPEMIKIEMLTKYNYELSQMFNRKVTKYEIVGLLSLFFSVKNIEETLSKVPINSFKNTMKQMEFPEDKIKDFINFLRGDKTQIPFAIIDSDYIVFGQWAIFAMALKYMGVLDQLSLIVKGKEKASLVFEQKIRDKMKDNGYIVPFDESYRKNDKSLDYDVIAIDKTNKQILIMEAKYRDIPSSAFSAKNLLNIKLDDEEFGENNLVKRQVERKKAMESDLSSLQQSCKNKGQDIDFTDYSIIPYVVLKFKPLIKEKDGVKLICFDDLNHFNT